MPLHVVATITAKPGAESAVRSALEELAVGTRAEQGCLSYDLYQSAADATVFITVEQWRAQADLDAHLLTPHVQAALAQVGDQLAAPPAIHPLQPVS